MKSSKQVWFALICMLAVAATLEARNVFVLSNGSGTTGQVNAFLADPFAQINTATISPAAFQVISNPSGTKYYVISKSGSDTVAVLDANFNVDTTKRFNLGQAEAAALSPNGTRLLVAAGALHIIDAVNDAVLSSSLDVGSTPIDVAVALDSSRAFVLSSASQRLSAVDLSTNTVVSPTLTIPGISTGVAVAPNGLVYVTTTNRVYEIDGRTMTLRGEFQLNGNPGKLVFTADGKYGIAANNNIITGSSLFVFDLTNRTLLNTLQAFGVTFDKLVVINNNKIFATSKTTQRLYDITINPLFPNEASFNTIGSLANIQSIAVSNEVPNPRSLFVTTLTQVYKFDMTVTPATPVAQFSIPAGNTGVLYTSPAITGTAATVLPFNATQGTTTTGTILPFIVRVLDVNGKPLAGVPVTFTTASGLVLQGASASTTADGYAYVTAVNPGVAGSYAATATIGTSGITTTFTLTVGGGSGSGGNSGNAGIFSSSGNGQMLLENFLLTDPLVVIVRDTQGNPLSGQTVTWNITNGIGTLATSLGSGATLDATTCTGGTCTSTTDSNGKAFVSLLAGQVPGGFSYAQQTITASIPTGQVTFITTTLLNNGFSVLPNTDLIKPTLEDRNLVVKVGTTVAGAIQARIYVVSGAQSGQGIPNVAINATTGFDPTQGPSVNCGDDNLSDSTGLMTCNLRVTGKVGTVPLTVNVGSIKNLQPITLRVDPGPPGLIRQVQGNNQSANPNVTLPLAFVAEISDGFGNVLPGTVVQWEVVTPGTITLQNVVGIADANGRVSALGRVAGTAGTYQVRLRAGSITANFNFTVNVTVTSLQLVSGDGQTGQINTAFAPVVVRVLDDKGQPVAGASVNFVVASGAATVSPASVATDSAGRASATVTAGSTAGAITVRASIGSLTPVTFNLTSILPGPVFNAQTIYNAAGGQIGIVPCGIVTIAGTGIATGVTGVAEPSTFLGLGLPTSFRNVEVLINGISSPIYHVANFGAGAEQVTVQAPCEISSPGTASVTVRVGGGSTTIANVPVFRVQPGIFETSPATGVKYAIVQRPDGAIVSASVPALRGQVHRMYATGLGAVSPDTATNRAGVGGQNVVANLVVGVNDEGVRIVGAQYMPGAIGVYVVDFEIPATATTGTNRPLALAAEGVAGVYEFGRSIIAAIQ